MFGGTEVHVECKKVDSVECRTDRSNAIEEMQRRNCFEMPVPHILIERR